MIQIFGGGMVNHTSFSVTKNFKLSLKPFIIHNRLRRGSLNRCKVQVNPGHRE